MKAHPCPCLVPRYTSGSVRGATACLPINCCRRCAFILEATWRNQQTRTAQLPCEVVLVSARKVEMNQSYPQNGVSAGACTMVIFGATGDLTKRKLMPALYNLAASNLLPKQFAIVGYSSSPYTDETFRDKLASETSEFATGRVDPGIWDWLLQRIHYVQADFSDPGGVERLSTKLAQVENDHGTRGNRIFYLATAPAFFAEVVRQLGKAGLTNDANGVFARVVIEKPFGRDLDSARQLNREITAVLDEKQIYRIDHYLGKE